MINSEHTQYQNRNSFDNYRQPSVVHAPSSKQPMIVCHLGFLRVLGVHASRGDRASATLELVDPYNRHESIRFSGCITESRGRAELVAQNSHRAPISLDAPAKVHFVLVDGAYFLFDCSSEEQ